MVLCIVIHVMPEYALDWVPGSGICLYQETLYRSVSCRRRLRRTAPCETPGMATQVRLAFHRRYWCAPSPAGPPGSSPLHLLHHLNLSFMIGMPNRSCILKLRPNQCFVCNFLSMPRCQCQLLCGVESEDISHFIFRCDILDPVRAPILVDIQVPIA